MPDKEPLFCSKAGLFCSKAGLFCNKGGLLKAGILGTNACKTKQAEQSM